MCLWDKLPYLGEKVSPPLSSQPRWVDDRGQVFWVWFPAIVVSGQKLDGLLIGVSVDSDPALAWLGGREGQVMPGLYSVEAISSIKWGEITGPVILVDKYSAIFFPHKLSKVAVC